MRSVDIDFIIQKAKHWVAFKFSKITIIAVFCYIKLCSLRTNMLDYLSAVKFYWNRRLLNRFRSGGHGLRVDTGRWKNNVHLDKKLLKTGCV